MENVKALDGVGDRGIVDIWDRGEVCHHLGYSNFLDSIMFSKFDLDIQYNLLITLYIKCEWQLCLYPKVLFEEL